MTDPDPRPAPMPQRLRELARENFALLDGVIGLYELAAAPARTERSK